MVNRIELAVLYFAGARLDAVSVPGNTRLKLPEIDFVLRDSGPVVARQDPVRVKPRGKCYCNARCSRF